MKDLKEKIKSIIHQIERSVEVIEVEKRKLVEISSQVDHMIDILDDSNDDFLEGAQALQNGLENLSEDLTNPKCRRVPEVQPTRPQVVEEISNFLE